MTTPVVTVDLRTPYKRIATLLAQHEISAVPVLVLGRHVAGVVSEADLLSAQERRLREAQLESSGHFRRHADVKRHGGLTAGELMTSPAITTHPDAPLPGRREADEQPTHQAAAGSRGRNDVRRRRRRRAGRHREPL